MDAREFERFDKLQSAADEARGALREHVRRVAVVWYGLGGPPRAAEPVTAEWLERYRELKNERDLAEDAIVAFFQRPDE